MRQASRGPQHSCPGGRAVDTDTFAVDPYLWDALTGQIIRTFREPHDGRDVRSVTFSPQGQSILSANEDRTARLWDLRNGKLTGLLTHPKKVRWASFSPSVTQAIAGQSEVSGRCQPV